MDTCELIIQRLKEAGIPLEIEFEYGHGTFQLRFDRAHLAQVIFNAMHNRSRHAKSGPISVKWKDGSK